jgi:hypothetical protein
MCLFVRDTYSILQKWPPLCAFGLVQLRIGGPPRMSWGFPQKRPCGLAKAHACALGAIDTSADTTADNRTACVSATITSIAVIFFIN